MDRYWAIIEDEEADAKMELDSNFDAGVNGLCHGGTCHDECDCWDSFQYAVRSELERQKKNATELSKCCDAEVYDDGEFCVECKEREPETYFKDNDEIAYDKEMRRMKRLYDGEVAAGLHTPSTAEERNLMPVTEV